MKYIEMMTSDAGLIAFDRIDNERVLITVRDCADNLLAEFTVPRGVLALLDQGVLDP